MSIFNSLGSNYDFKFVLKSLFSKRDGDLKNFLEKKYKGQVILTYKGRDAIEMALSGLPPGSLVAINGFTCFAVYEAIKKAGMEALYLDIEKGELNFSPESLKKAGNVKAVIIQNTLGYPCDIEKIAQVCKENKIILIEDLAHCVGTRYESGIEAGTVGDFVALSFSQDKMIDAISGGALIKKNER